jgi:cytoskeletal protein RodZ
MEDSVGKRLRNARLKQGVSIDEAAHATRLRPDKIVALENDDYSTFASNVYAKGFLQIYGRFLDVDVAEFAATLEGNASISIEDYQYLNSGAPPRREERSSSVVYVERRGPGLGALFTFLFLLGLVGAGFYFYVNSQRLATDPVARVLPATPAPSVVAVPPIEKNPAATVPAATPASPALRAAAPAPPVVADRDFVAPAALAPSVATPAPNEVLVLPLRKTWIVVRKDDPNSPPIFEDYVYPDVPPLKLKGTRFFIEARDPTAIQIRKNGAPMAYQSPGGEVQ